jgi:hypothetical protein
MPPSAGPQAPGVPGRHPHGRQRAGAAADLKNNRPARDRPRGAEPPGTGRHGAQSEEPAAEQTPSAEGVKKTGDLIIAENTGY